DGTVTENVECEYPLGHRFRRDEAIPKVVRKFTANMAGHYSSKQQEKIHEACLNEEKLENMNVNEFVDLFLI
ncbi:2-methylcitrate dehydratase, partial [Bacillus mycoides]|nr:2-methylcitrate dehydratase [Bacillus mycoides]